MSKKEETVFKERVKKILTKEFPNSWAVKTQQVSLRGTPDILMCVRGFFIAMELKTDSNKSKDLLQDYNLDKIKMSGGRSYKVTPSNLEQVLSEIRRIYDKN